jgi:predicted MPP superfamily phosphohydrolase
MNRRKFLGLVLKTAAAGGAYSLLEAKWCRITPVSIGMPRLPENFAGLRIAFLADIHHGPFVPLAYVRHVVRMANALAPDLILLGGDYVHRNRSYIAPCIHELGGLRAPLGVHAVLGNHDHWESASETKQALAQAKIQELTNTGTWLERGGARLRLGGVGDLWQDRQRLQPVLDGLSDKETCLLLSHNPDYVERIQDRRIGLVLSGHTHGGQVVVPGYGPPILPSRYKQKYAHGLVQGPVARVFVTRGVGTVTPPVRFFCRPEIALITLQPERA